MHLDLQMRLLPVHLFRLFQFETGWRWEYDVQYMLSNGRNPTNSLLRMLCPDKRTAVRLLVLCRDCSKKNRFRMGPVYYFSSM